MDTADWRIRGYMSILPVDQGIEHSAGASFAPNPIYFDSENIVKLAMEAGCNAVASTYGVLGSVARKYAHKIPFIVKINHNEFLSYPNTFDQVMFGTIKSAWDMGAVAVGATIYFGSEESRRAAGSRWQKPSNMPISLVWLLYFGATLGIMRLKWTGVDYHASADLEWSSESLWE
jgi:class I fructose-bisphosphate aldolase